MAVEIERKFLVTGNFKQYAVKSEKIVQAYLSKVPENIVRIRIMDEQAFLTIKDKSPSGCISRNEWEFEIPVKDGREILKICKAGIIEKTRYYIQSGDHIFEVDEFHGKNEGLIVAEIELESENEKFNKPEWLGEEVTGDPKYFNSRLSM
jgi:adenylate cyclase